MANNLYPNCPPLMADGRHITDYSPRCLQELLVKDEIGKPLTSYMYRQYLVNNAEQLIGQMQADTMRTYACAACASAPAPIPAGENIQTCTQNNCNFTPSGVAGSLGLERS